MRETIQLTNAEKKLHVLEETVEELLSHQGLFGNYITSYRSFPGAV